MSGKKKILLAMLILIAVCQCGCGKSKKDVITITNVSYDPTKVFRLWKLLNIL